MDTLIYIYIYIYIISKCSRIKNKNKNKKKNKKTKTKTKTKPTQTYHANKKKFYPGQKKGGKTKSRKRQKVGCWMKKGNFLQYISSSFSLPFSSNFGEIEFWWI